MQIIFIEGVPGTGKSTMAERLCVLANESGRSARWYLEESCDHPVHPKPWPALKAENSFVEHALDSWSRFVDNCVESDVLHILDASAFQSTVRFMLERRHKEIDQYYKRFEEIVSVLNPRMIYLRPDDVLLHSTKVAKFRGKEWSGKVSDYLVGTDYSTHHALKGLTGMHQFWAIYAQQCDALVNQTSIPTKTIKCVGGEWERHMTEANIFVFSVDEDRTRFNS